MICILIILYTGLYSYIDIHWTVFLQWCSLDCIPTLIFTGCILTLIFSDHILTITFIGLYSYNDFYLTVFLQWYLLDHIHTMPNRRGIKPSHKFKGWISLEGCTMVPQNRDDARYDLVRNWPKKELNKMQIQTPILLLYLLDTT